MSTGEVSVIRVPSIDNLGINTKKESTGVLLGHLGEVDSVEQDLEGSTSNSWPSFGRLAIDVYASPLFGTVFDPS